MLKTALNIPLLTTLLLWAIALPTRAQLIPELETRPAAIALPPAQWRQADVVVPIAQAQTTEVVEIPKLIDRWGVNLQTGPEVADGSAFLELYTFQPFSQVAGGSAFFLEGQMRMFSHDTAYGGNARVGYRKAIPESDLIWGTYLGIDVQRTEFRNTFTQFGLGAELTAQDWEARINAYLPFGDPRQEAAQFREGFFTGYQLLINRTAEVAMTGLDLEGGYRVLDWADGSLYAYASPYLISANGAGTYIGMRGRLLAEFGDRYSAGLAISSDGRFGTNFAFQVGALFGKRRNRKQDETATESFLARMAQPVRRQDTMAIDRQETGFQAALNPDTGEEYRFLYVVDGAPCTGDGTFENPFCEATQATAIANASGNDVIYVDSGDRSGLDGFAMPNNVSALSTGVSQFLDFSTRESDLADSFSFQLPGSGTGTLPLINGATATANGLTGMIGMGTNSTVSGFEISSMGANENGVFSGNADGTMTVDRNQITTTGDTARGIFLYTRGGTLTSATISGNSISTSGDTDASGIYLHALGTTVGTVSVTGNQVTTTGDTRSKGIYLRARTNSTVETITVAGNSVSTAGDTNSFGIQVNAGTSTLTTVTVSSNTVVTGGNQGTGIYVRAQNNRGTITSATISGNNVLTTGNYGDGIVVTASGPNANITQAIVSGNTVSTAGNYADGVFIQTLGNTSNINSVSITNNVITQAGVHLVIIQARNGGERICVANFSGNTGGTPNIVVSGGNDLNFNPTAGTPGTVNFVGFDNISTNNSGFDDIVITNGTVTTVGAC